MCHFGLYVTARVQAILDLCMGQKIVRVNPAIDGCTFRDDYNRISITGLYVLFLDILFKAFPGEMENINWG